MSAKNKALIGKANEAFRNNDIEALLALCTEDFSWTMVGGATASGKASVREWMKEGPSTPPKFTIDTVIAEDDFVTCIGDMTMDGKDGTEPYAYCDVWRIEGDEIAELRAFVIKTPAE